MNHRVKQLLVLCSSIVALVAGELILRWFFPQRTLSILKTKQLACYQSSSYLPYEYKPGCVGHFVTPGGESSVRINNVGFRGHDISEKTMQRILFVGDSYFFGYGVEEEQTVARLIEQQFGIEVVNAGIWGFGPDSEYLLTRQKGFSLDPDILVVSLFPKNDLRDIAESVWNESELGELRSITSDKFVDSEGFLRRHAVSRRYYIPFIRESHVAALLIDGGEMLFSKLRSLVVQTTRPAEGISTDGGADLKCLYEETCTGRWQEAKMRAQRTIHLFRNLSDQMHIPVLFVIIPYSSQIDGSEPKETIFHEMVRSEGLQSVDLLRAFEHSGFSSEQLFLEDGHWSAEGNQVAANEIASWLCSLRVVANCHIVIKDFPLARDRSVLQ